MDIYPDHACWKRNRPAHHSGAIRSYVREAEGDDGYPRGPNASPRPCALCEPCDSQYDSASPDREEWILSNDDIFDNSQEESSFDMKRKDGVHMYSSKTKHYKYRKIYNVIESFYFNSLIYVNGQSKFHRINN